MGCNCAGLRGNGTEDISVPFFDRADPVTSFMSAFQTFVQAPVTGRWNRTTHEAFAEYLRTYSVIQGRSPDDYPAWGADPGKVVDFIWLVMVPVQDTFQELQGLLLNLGLPTTYEDYAAFVSSNLWEKDAIEQRGSFQAALNRSFAQVRAIENGEEPEVLPSGKDDTLTTGPGTANTVPSFWSKYKWWLVAGAVAVGTVGFLLLSNKAQEEK